jgi:hypothetical protein
VLALHIKLNRFARVLKNLAATPFGIMISG